MAQAGRIRHRLRVKRGDVLIFAVQAKLPPAANLLLPPAPQPLAGWSAVFTAKYQLPDPELAAACKAVTPGPGSTPGASIVVEAPMTTYVLITMPGSATQLFPDGVVELEFTVRVAPPAGGYVTIAEGVIEVSPGASLLF